MVEGRWGGVAPKTLAVPSALKVDALRGPDSCRTIPDHLERLRHRLSGVLSSDALPSDAQVCCEVFRRSRRDRALLDLLSAITRPPCSRASRDFSFRSDWSTITASFGEPMNHPPERPNMVSGLIEKDREIAGQIEAKRP